MHGSKESGEVRRETHRTAIGTIALPKSSLTIGDSPLAQGRGLS